MTQEANSDELIHLCGDEGLEGVGGEAQEGALPVMIYTKYLPLYLCNATIPFPCTIFVFFILKQLNKCYFTLRSRLIPNTVQNNDGGQEIISMIPLSIFTQMYVLTSKPKRAIFVYLTKWTTSDVPHLIVTRGHETTSQQTMVKWSLGL